MECQFGIKISKTIENLKLIIANEQSADKLKINIGDSCFLLETLAYLSDGSI